VTVEVWYRCDAQAERRLVWGVDLVAALRTAWLTPGAYAVYPR